MSIYAIGSCLSGRGWHLNSLQNPAGVHICLTPANAGRVDELLADLPLAVEEVRPGVARSGGSSVVRGV